LIPPTRWPISGSEVVPKVEALAGKLPWPPAASPYATKVSTGLLCDQEERKLFPVLKMQEELAAEAAGERMSGFLRVLPGL
jgi:hypothetical protein